MNSFDRFGADVDERREGWRDILVATVFFCIPIVCVVVSLVVWFCEVWR